MSTEISPPTPAADPASRPPEPGHRAAPRVIALLTAALGVGVVVAAVASTALPAFALADAWSESRVLDVDGVTSLNIDVDAMSLTVVFADVDQATLDVRDSTGGAWTLDRDGDVIEVSTPRGSIVSWFRGGNGRATLTLPDELDGLDADVRIASGSVDADGAFGDLGLRLDAGQLTVSGTADTVVADVSAGRGDVDLGDVTTADLSLGAGTLITRLRGPALDAVTASVSAGSLELTLPDDVYDVTSNVSAGSVDNQLRTASNATRTVEIDVSAGNALLTAD